MLKNIEFSALCGEYVRDRLYLPVSKNIRTILRYLGHSLNDITTGDIPILLTIGTSSERFPYLPHFLFEFPSKIFMPRLAVV